MFQNQKMFRNVLAAVFCVLVTSNACADQWPGTGPSPGGALAARVIGLLCAGSLSNEEIYDVDIYVAKKRLQGMKAASDPAQLKFEQHFYPSLEAKYIDLYRDGKRCTADAAAEAKDMVKRVRLEK